jgi:hypothetical protein
MLGKRASTSLNIAHMQVIFIIVQLIYTLCCDFLAPIQPTARQGRFPQQSTPCKSTTPRQQSTPCKVNTPRQSTPSSRLTASKVTTPSRQKMKPPPEVAQYSPQIQVFY